jgi:SPP1 gp7 family putative phage head morphogenesis protein
MQSHKEISMRRAKNIAYDQTRKAFNNINKARMDKLGIREFEWLHSGGSTHPRKLHQELSGKIFSLDDLPIIGTMYGEEVRGIPGQLPNCRCKMLPVISFNEE